MPNLSLDDIFHFIQNLQPSLFYKWILLLIVLGFIIFHIVVLNQIRSLDKVVSQPSSSAILGFFSIIFLVAGISLFIFIYTSII